MRPLLRSIAMTSTLFCLILTSLARSQTPASTVKVTISPNAPSIVVGTTTPFTATVTGNANIAVTWTINGVTGGDSTNGTISIAGLYTAPASIPTTNPVTVKATSVADQTQSASTTVTIQPAMINSVTVLSDSTQKANSLHIAAIDGNGFLTLGAANSAVQIYVAPSDGVTILQAQIASDTLIEARFTAGPNYALQSVVVVPATHAPLSFVQPAVTCKQEDLAVTYEILPYDQAKNAFGNGIAKNFHIVQLSIVNACASNLVVPLGGVNVVPIWHADASNACKNDATKSKCGYEDGPKVVAPLSVDHVTSVFNSDRTSTGSRAMIFNSILALATLGSAIEPFFGTGFTKGVSILGGGFHSAALQISPDMTSQELKAITGESFESSETIGAKGTPPVQKFIFIPRNDVKLPSGKRKRIDDIKTISVAWFVVTSSTNTSTAVNAPATASKPPG